MKKKEETTPEFSTLGNIYVVFSRKLNKWYRPRTGYGSAPHVYFVDSIKNAKVYPKIHLARAGAKNVLSIQEQFEFSKKNGHTPPAADFDGIDLDLIIDEFAVLPTGKRFTI